MSRKNTVSMNLFSPNLVNVCIDTLENGEIRGRMYHYYGEQPVRFESILQLLKQMEALFDGIAFPQASTRSRSFRKQSAAEVPYNIEKRPERRTDEEQLTGQRGRLATLLIQVGYRQNSTWEGEALWLEQNEKKEFRNELELLQLLELALQECKIQVNEVKK